MRLSQAGAPARLVPSKALRWLDLEFVTPDRKSLLFLQTLCLLKLITERAGRPPLGPRLSGIPACCAPALDGSRKCRGFRLASCAWCTIDRSCFSGELRGLWVRICGVGDWLGPCLRGEPWARHRCAGLGRARLGMFMAAPGSPGAVASGAQADFDPQGG